MRRRIGGYSTNPKPTDQNMAPGDRYYEWDTGERFTYDGDSYHNSGAAGVPAVGDGFRPSAYQTDLTMNGTAQSVALATGATRIRVVNHGATLNAIRVVFGTSAGNAESNLNIASGAATTGVWVGSAPDGFTPELILGVPTNATHYAVANDVNGHTQVVTIEQGV